MSTPSPATTPVAVDAAPPLLQIDDLTVRYAGTRRYAGTEAVSRVGLRVDPGELVSVVGESGSGKTTLVHAALGLLPAGATVAWGTIRFSGIDVTHWSDARLSRVRGNYVGHVPQDPTPRSTRSNGSATRCSTPCG